MEKLLQLNEFFVEGGRPEMSHVLLTLIQPTSETEEKEKGYFFAICEINHSTSEQLTELQRIMEEIENGYYETADTSERNSLEIVLEKINQQNLSLFSLNLSLSCIVGAVKSNSVVFSYCGEPNILLFYKSKEGVYKKMDLVEKQDEEEKEKILFSQIVQGKINFGDYFFLGTQKITNYFNHDRLQKIITVRTPEQSTEHIHRVLSELKNGLSFGGLIIHLKEKLSPEIITEKKSRPQTSGGEKINSLFLTEQNTANTLSPSLWENLITPIKNKINKTREEKLKNNFPEKESDTINITAAESIHLKQRFTEKLNKDNFINIAKIIGKYLLITLKGIGQLLWWIFLMVAALFTILGKALKDLFIFVFNFKNQRRQIKERWSQAFYSYKQNFKHLPLLTKFLFVSSLIVLTIFVVSLFYLHNAKQIQKENLYYQETFSLLEEKMEEIKITMIYGDQISINSSKNEIKEILNNLICRENDKAICRDLTDRFKEIEKEIQKFVKEPKITLLTNWSVLGFNNVIKFTKIEGKILSFSYDNDTIYTYNLLTKDGTVTLKIPGNKNPYLVASLKDGKNSLFLNENKELYKYNSEENNFSKISLTFQNNEAQIKEILPYSSRLYTLDKFNNQIYRHDAISSGYGLGKDWIKSTNIDIRNAVSFAVDGDLYLLKDDGNILKFTAGEIQPFVISSLEPALTSGIKIWTYSEDKYIYILDNKEKRLILLNKDGTLKEQYTSDQFEEPTDMIIEEKNKTAYILDKGRVFQIELK